MDCPIKAVLFKGPSLTMTDREGLHPHSAVRGGSLQAGEDLPGRASVPGVQAGGLQPVPPAKKPG